MKKILFAVSTFAFSIFGSIAAFANEAAKAGDSASVTAVGDTTTVGAVEATAAPTADPGFFGGLFGGSNWWIWIIIYGVMIALFYFLLIRPNRKKQKAEEALKNSIAMDDYITTIGGITGRIVSIKDDEITIESSMDRTLVTFKKWAVRDVKKADTLETTEEKKEEKKD